MATIYLDDIFAPFYEDPSPKDIIKRKEQILSKYKTDPAESGVTIPIIPLDDLAPGDRKEVDKCAATLEAQLQPASKPCSMESTPSTPLTLAPVPFDRLSYAIAKNTLHSLMRQPNSQARPKPTHLELTELFLSRIILRRFNGDFYFFTGGVYQYVPPAELSTLIFDVIYDALQLDGNARVISGVASLLSAHPGIRMNATTDSPDRLYFLNGVLEISQGVFRPIGPQDFFTSYIAVTYPINEMPTCPIFDSFLTFVSGGNPVIAETIWEMLGYLLVPGNEAKAFFILQGVGNSGKSVLGNLISELFNQEAVSHLDIFRLGGRFDTSALRRVRINISMDLPSGRLNRQAISSIRSITGDDGVPLEPKFKDVEFGKISCKLLFGSNHRISLAEIDEAFLNRLVVIPFQYAVPKEHQDKGLLQKLRGEKSAIVVRALGAYQELAARNFQFLLGAGEAGQDFCAYTESEDVIADFLAQCCIFEQNAITPTSTLYHRFCQFCAVNHLPNFDNSNTFSRVLNKHCGGRIYRKKARVGGESSNCYHGIRLLD